MTEQLTWTNEKRTLRSLTPWERNPRYIKSAQAERLLESFNEFGQVLPICISPSGDILDGHQRRSVIGAADEYGLDYEVDVRVASRELTERERQKLTVYLHQGATGAWDWEKLETEFDFSDLLSWGFDESEFDFAASERLAEDRRAKDMMGTLDVVDGYDFHIDAPKLGYRIEAAAHCAQRQRCLELFAGLGLLSYWYGRLFDEVVRVDSSANGQPDFQMTAKNFIESEMDFTQPFDFVDFDDEGCPSAELQTFFERIATHRWPPFVLCLTDGAGLNLKVRGKINLQKLYRWGNEGVRVSSTELYEAHPAMVEHHLMTIADEAGYTAKRISLFRGSHGNVSYGCYAIASRESWPDSTSPSP